jgi:hypothetical protein
VKGLGRMRTYLLVADPGHDLQGAVG